MKIKLKQRSGLHETLYDTEDSNLFSDAFLKKISQQLKEDHSIHSLVIEDADLYKKGIESLRYSILGHPCLRVLVLRNVTFNSYPCCSNEEGFFPKDLDQVVHHLSAILRDGRLETIDVTNLNFKDRTERQYVHFDMVEPSIMRDLMQEEKEPLYLKEVITSLKHNPYLKQIRLSMSDIDATLFVEEIQKEILSRESAVKINSIFQGTYGASEVYLMPEIWNFFTTWLWLHHNKIKKMK